MAYFRELGSALVPFRDQTKCLVIKRDLQLNDFQRIFRLTLYHNNSLFVNTRTNWWINGKSTRISGAFREINVMLTVVLIFCPDNVLLFFPHRIEEFSFYRFLAQAVN